MAFHINKPIPKFSPMAIDIETRNNGYKAGAFDPHLGEILSVQVSNGTDIWILLDFHGFEEIKPHLADESIVKIAHNAKFEYKWFKHKLGCEMKPLFDTQLAEDTLYKGLDHRTEYPTNLEETALRRLNVMLTKEVRDEFPDHPGFEERQVTFDQIMYMAYDVLYLQEIRDQQLNEAEETGLKPTFDLENDCVPATAELELTGKAVDIDLWYQQVNQMQQLVDRHEALAREVIKDDTLTLDYADGPREFNKETINFRSPKQAQALYTDVFGEDITHPKTGKPSTDATWVLTPKLEAGEFSSRGEEFTRELLNSRMWHKRIGYDYAKFIHPVTGKIHCDYRQDGTDTGRFSSAKPNLQQVPRPTAEDEPNIRNIFVADSEEYTIIRADYSQQEPRILGQILGLPSVIEACNTEDVYAGLGTLIFGRTITKKDEERHLCKTALLGKSYGQGAPAFCRTINKPWDEGSRIYNLIESAFPVDKFADEMRSQAAQYGFVTTLSGRRRYFDYRRGSPYNEPLNSPVQGTAADMFKTALVKVHNALTKLKKEGKLDSKTRVWHIIHDEIEVHCLVSEVDFVLPLVTELMEEAGREICPDVLHVAEAEYGYRWDK